VTRKRALRTALVYAGIGPFLVIALFPVLWMAITAFKDDLDLYRLDRFPFWFHSGPTLKHVALLFTQTWFATWLGNTATVAACVVAITLVASVPAAYALARTGLPASENLGIAMFMTYLVPPIILFLPLTRIVGFLGLFDSRWALVVVYPTFTIPFCTWFLMGFFRTLPKEIEEASWVDGCGLVGGLVRVVLPLSAPGVATTAIYAFTLSMQEYLYAVIYAAPTEEKMVSVGLPTMLIRGDIYYWGSLMSAALIVGIPTAILYNVVLDNFIEGLVGTGSRA